jgi:hypothetical protein
MATAKPHLLTLPRELRDHICSYLHEEGSFQWDDWKHIDTFKYGPSPLVFAMKSDPEYSISHLLWQEFPLHSLLLTHSRLRDEYLASPLFTNICITIRANLWGGYLLSGSKFSTRKHAMAIAAIFCAHHITLYFKGERDNRPDRRQWDNLFHFVDTVVAVASNMQTLRIAMMIGGGDTIVGDSIMSEHGDVDIGHIDVSTAHHPETLAGLSLVQSGKGHRIGYYDARWSGDHSSDQSDDESTDDGEDDNEINSEDESKSERKGDELSEDKNDDETENSTENSSLLALCHLSMEVSQENHVCIRVVGG